MNLNQKVVDSFKEVEIGRVFTTSETKDIVERKYKINRASFQPSDMCYNRTNKGVERTPSYNEANSRIFLWIKKGLYKYVGPDYVLPEGEKIHYDPR